MRIADCYNSHHQIIVLNTVLGALLVPILYAKIEPGQNHALEKFWQVWFPTVKEISGKYSPQDSFVHKSLLLLRRIIGSSQLFNIIFHTYPDYNDRQKNKFKGILFMAEIINNGETPEKPGLPKVQISLTWKIAIFFSLAFAGIFSLSLESLSRRIAENADHQVMLDLTQVLEGAAEGVDVDMLIELAREGESNEHGFSDDPRYVVLMTWLDTVHSAEPDAWPYLYIPAEKEGYVYFVVDLYAIYEPETSSKFMELYKSNSGYILIGLEEQTFRAVDVSLVAWLKDAAKSIEEGNKGVETWLSSSLRKIANWLAGHQLFAPKPFGTYEDQYGRWASGYMPLEDSNGQKVAGIGVDFQAEMINQIRSESRAGIQRPFLIAYLILLPLVILISIKLTRPIAELTEIATVIGIGKNQVKFPPPAEKKHKDEIDVLENVLFDTYQKLQHANQQLQGLSHQLISDREQYRKELARDLHDNVLSYLSVLSTNQNTEPDKDTMQENYKQLIARLRNTIFSLRSPMMEYGLFMAIEDLIDSFESRCGNGRCEIIFEIPASKARFDNTTETHIYRIIQQALENACEHSKATKIRISGEICENRINVTIEDNGKGIPDEYHGEIAPDYLEPKRKYGLIGMIERATLIGADLSIQAGPDDGTVIHLSWKP
jgi:signal transduction histidine kinase